MINPDDTPSLAPDSELRAKIQSMIEAKKADKADKPKRKQKVEPDSPPELDVGAQTAALAPVTYALFAPIIDRWTPEKPYTEDEATLLTGALIAVSVKYPDFKYTEELVCGMVLAAQFGGRALTARARNAKERGDEFVPLAVVASNKQPV
jgi:hypothetical protein